MIKAYLLGALLLISTDVWAEQQSQQQLERIVSELSALEHCQQTQDCPEAPGGPRNSFYLLGELINKQLDELAAWQQHYAVNQTSRQVLLDFLHYPNEFVQSNVVKILGSMAACEDIAHQLIAVVVDTREKQLMLPLLKQLQRYPQLQNEIDSAFSQVLTRGSFTGGKVLAHHIQPFLNNNNLIFYQKLQKQLPVNSAKAKALQEAIERQVNRS